MQILKYIIFITLGINMSASVLPKSYSKILSNGLQVVAIPMNNKSNVVSTTIFYKVGSGDEIMGKSGIAHMLEHMNFKSTKNLQEGEFDTTVKEFGGVNNASTGFDYTKYYIKSSSENMGKSMKLFAELMENLNLKNEEFQKERDVVAEERLWRTENSPMGYLYFKLFNALYDYQSYHWTPIGFMQDIQNWNIKDIKDFHKKYYTPSNAILLVAGDIDKKTVFNEASKYFEKIKDKKINNKFYIKEDNSKIQKDIIIEKTSQVEMIAIAFKTDDFRSKDQISLEILSEVLSGGKTSRLYNKIINQEKLASKIYAYDMDLKHSGVFIIIAICTPKTDAKILKKEILKEINILTTTKIKEKELIKIKKNIKADTLFSFSDSMSIADLFGSFYAKGDIKPLLEYEDNIEKIKRQDILNVAKKYFNNPTTVILKNKIQQKVVNQ
jgi:predicted Zn-dependent peptidase